MTLEIPSGVVIVTGAAATGKTTLAQGLARTAGRRQAVVLSGKEIFESCRSQDEELDDWEMQFRWRLFSLQKILEITDMHKSVVFEMQFPEAGRLDHFLACLRARDQCLPISLVKVTATPEEQLRYAKQCDGVDEYAIDVSNRRFEQILSMHYDNHALAKECVFSHDRYAKAIFVA